MKASQTTLIVSTIGIILAVLGLYFGAILPFLKAQSFINASRQMSSVRTVDDFRKNFDASFDFYSPVGTEEISKFLGSNIVSILQQGQPEEVSRQLVAYIEPHLFKDEPRHLLLLAQMYQLMWQKYGQEADYEKMVGYLEKAHEIGPNLPPPLYRLLDAYSLHGDKANANRIGQLILEKWPQDTKVRELIK